MPFVVTDSLLVRLIEGDALAFVLAAAYIGRHNCAWPSGDSKLIPFRAVLGTGRFGLSCSARCVSLPRRPAGTDTRLEIRVHTGQLKRLDQIAQLLARGDV